MKKFISALIIVFAFGVTWPVVAQGQSGCTGGYNSGYLHVDCATSVAREFVNDNYLNPSYNWASRRSYRRFSNTRVDILANVWRNGVYGCRWTIVRGDDWSKYVNWHPDSTFSPGCGGV